MRASETNRLSAMRRRCCDFDLPEIDAWEIVADWNAVNTPPLDEKELRQAFSDASQYGKGSVGSKLAELRPQKRLVMPITSTTTDPASELESLLEKEIDGSFTNIEWPWPILTDLGQCLTPGTRTMIVGTIGGSKSLAVLQAVSSWVEAGLKVAVLELERNRDFHLKRVLAQRTGIADFTKPSWVRANAAFVWEQFNDHREYLSRVGTAIHTAPRQFSTPQAAEWIEKLAGEGHKVIIIDPVTALARGREPWSEDDAFMSRAEKAASTSGAALVFITHAKKGAGNLPDLDSRPARLHGLGSPTQSSGFRPMTPRLPHDQDLVRNRSGYAQSNCPPAQDKKRRRHRFAAGVQLRRR